MSMLLVGYDLNRTGQEYAKVIEYLEGYGTYWHHLDSTWLIKTSKSCADVIDEMRAKKLIDSNDEILVVNITGDNAAWYGFSEKGSAWLKKNL